MKRADRQSLTRLIRDAELSLEDARHHLSDRDFCLLHLRAALRRVKRAKKERKRVEEDG